MAGSSFKTPSAYATTSLGAVGGPKGTAAGALKILLEFATQYDSKALEQVNRDLFAFSKQQERAYQDAQDHQEKINNLQRQEADGRKLIAQYQGSLTKIAKETFKQAVADIGYLDDEIRTAQEKLARRKSKAARLERDQLINEQERRIKGLAILTGLDEDLLRAGLRHLQNSRQIAQWEEKRNFYKQRAIGLTETVNNLLREQAVLQSVRSEFFPKLGNLALGALGGIFGGALFGAGFAMAQDLIDDFTNKLRDIIDPAAKGREAIKELGDEINKLASAEKISQLDAATQYLRELGSFGRPNLPGNATNPVTAELLAQAAAIAQLRGEQEQWAKALAGTESIEIQRRDLINSITEAALKQNQAYQDLLVKRTSDQEVQLDANKLAAVNAEIAALETNTRNAATSLVDLKLNTTDVAVAADRSKEALEALAQVRLDALNNQLQDTKAALLSVIDVIRDANVTRIEAGLEQTLQGITDTLDGQIRIIEAVRDANLARIQGQKDALKLEPSARTRSLEAALDALDDAGPSRRTQQLTAAIEALNRAQERRAFLEQLADIRQERRLLILRRELSLTKERINIYNYQGEARLVAIDAEIDRLNKQGEAQDRLNQLLDLQYRANKLLVREEGETIQDYLQRRAQEYRSLLSEQANLDRQSKVDNLQSIREQVEFRIQLRELEQQKIALIRERELKLYLDNLQAQLQASQEADQAALEAKRERLQEELEASKAADQAALDAKKDALDKEADKVRATAAANIEEARKEAKEKEEAAKAAAKTAIEEENRRAEKAKEAAQRTSETIIRLANKTEVEKLQLAMTAAKTLEDLEIAAGGLAGSAFAYEQLKASVKSLGLPSWMTESLLANAAALRSSYLAQLSGLNIGRAGVLPGYADGGVFPLRNSMNFGNNMKVGERGEELGVVLSNRVTRALRESQGGMNVGSMVFEVAEDPYRAQYRIEQTIRDIVREELHG